MRLDFTVLNIGKNLILTNKHIKNWVVLWPFGLYVICLYNNLTNQVIPCCTILHKCITYIYIIKFKSPGRYHAAGVTDVVCKGERDSVSHTSYMILYISIYIHFNLFNFSRVTHYEYLLKRHYLQYFCKVKKLTFVD